MLGNELSLAFTEADATVYALAASPGYAEDGICYAATSGGLYRSADGGSAWELLRISEETGTQPGAQLAATAVALSPDRSVFAAVKGGILRSSDGGDTWFAAKFPAPPPLFTSLAISPNFAQDGLMLAGSMEDGLFSSTNRGVNWQPWNFGLFDLSLLCLAASPNLHVDETIFAGTETGLYVSGNGGRAWRESRFPSDCAPILSLAYMTAPPSAFLLPDCGGKDETMLLAGTEEHGLFVLDYDDYDGAGWRRIAPDALPGAVNQLQVLNKNDGGAEIYALIEDGVLISRDAGGSWQYLVQTEAPPSAFLLPESGGNTLFLALTGIGILKYEL